MPMATGPVRSVLKWMFDECTARSDQRQGSHEGAGLKNVPTTRRTYLLRRRVKCDCDRTMMGTARGDVVYYRCHPLTNNRGRPDKYADHPPTVYMREDLILTEVTRFFAEHVFVPQRVSCSSRA
jgi:site-specific DNA recombinase